MKFRLSLVLLVFTWNLSISRLEGALMIAALISYVTYLVRRGETPLERELDPVEHEPASARHFGLFLLGLAGIIGGAQLLVWGASELARSAGVPEWAIGTTIVAGGTSLPELVTAIVAARKRATQLILGNLLGSNLFNSLAVGGVIAVVGSGPIDDRGLATFGVVGMVLVAVAAWAFMVTLKRVHKIEAVLLLAGWLISVVLMAGESTEVEEAASAEVGPEQSLG